MELIITPPAIAVQFRVSLMHSLLTVAGLLHLGQGLEGVSDWVHRHPQNTETLNPLSMLILFATGMQGYLIDSVPVDHPADRDFDTLWQHLEQLDPVALQQAVQRALLEYMIYWEIVDKHTTIEQMTARFAPLLQQAFDYHQSRWDIAPLMTAKAFANLVRDAQALHQQLLSGIRYLWDNLYREQAAEDMEKHQAAIDYHGNQPYYNDFPAIFKATTGRNIGQYLQERLSRIDTIEMIPSCHVGANITLAMLGRKCWIGFNANLIPIKKGNVSTSIAELYPVLKALADETRLKIVAFLGNQELNVGDIAEALGLTQSTTSRHLTLLAKTEILTMRRDGAMRYYSVNPETLKLTGRQLQQLP